MAHNCLHYVDSDRYCTGYLYYIYVKALSRVSIVLSNVTEIIKN